MKLIPHILAKTPYIRVSPAIWSMHRSVELPATDRTIGALDAMALNR